MELGSEIGDVTRGLSWRRIAWDTVLPEQSRQAWRPDIHVRYPDGSVFALCAVPAIDRMQKLADRPNRRAWIGGWGRDMVVLFPPGPLGARSHPIPAYSIDPREDG
ncbi:hypothetical protein [Amycolatopsis sp. lyj-346]|uniref:hypothetical protein n=1 Tax=Amycolatopsis sp. lyj-346 TaxID=2789289 RepID=UPI00397801A7